MKYFIVSSFMLLVSGAHAFECNIQVDDIANSTKKSVKAVLSSDESFENVIYTSGVHVALFKQSTEVEPRYGIAVSTGMPELNFISLQGNDVESVFTMVHNKLEVNLKTVDYTLSAQCKK